MRLILRALYELFTLSDDTDQLVDSIIGDGLPLMADVQLIPHALAVVFYFWQELILYKVVVIDIQLWLYVLLHVLSLPFLLLLDFLQFLIDLQVYLNIEVDVHFYALLLGHHLLHLLILFLLFGGYARVFQRLQISMRFLLRQNVHLRCLEFVNHFIRVFFTDRTALEL